MVFHGFVSPGLLREKVKLLNPILVMPSRSEGRMPYVAHTKIYEYLSYGLPIVASDLPSVREVFSGNDAVVLVNPGSPNDLAEGIRWVLQNPIEARKFGILAKELARKYSWKERAKSLSKVFKTVTC